MIDLGLNLRFVAHYSMSYAHIQVYHDDETGAHYEIHTPVIKEIGWGKEFGTPEHWGRFNDWPRNHYVDGHTFKLEALKRLKPDEYDRLMSAANKFKETKRQWRRHKHRFTAKELAKQISFNEQARKERQSA